MCSCPIAGGRASGARKLIEGAPASASSSHVRLLQLTGGARGAPQLLLCNIVGSVLQPQQKAWPLGGQPLLGVSLTLLASHLSPKTQDRPDVPAH